MRYDQDYGVLSIAGTGAMTPLAWELAKEWAKSQPEPRVIVEASVGSVGGVRAAAEGAVDLGMVGRELTSTEKGWGLHYVPVAKDAVVWAAHPSVTIESLSSTELVDLLMGRATRYHNGVPATVFLRDRDDSAHTAFERWMPHTRAAREDAYASRRFRVLLHDDSMGESLAVTPGAMGIFSYGAVVSQRLALRVLPVDGVAPSPQAIEEGRWKAARELAFVMRVDRAEKARGFLSFVASAAGSAVIRQAGYLPMRMVAP